MIGGVYDRRNPTVYSPAFNFGVTMPMSKTYIGDGIYAEVLPSTAQIRLTTENGLQVTNEIYFEDETIMQFLLWLQSLGIELPKK